jgi:hypothetical protein
LGVLVEEDLKLAAAEAQAVWFTHLLMKLLEE